MNVLKTYACTTIWLVFQVEFNTWEESREASGGGGRKCLLRIVRDFTRTSLADIWSHRRHLSPSQELQVLSRNSVHCVWSSNCTAIFLRFSLFLSVHSLQFSRLFSLFFLPHFHFCSMSELFKYWCEILFFLTGHVRTHIVYTHCLTHLHGTKWPDSTHNLQRASLSSLYSRCRRVLNREQSKMNGQK